MQQHDALIHYHNIMCVGLTEHFDSLPILHKNILRSTLSDLQELFDKHPNETLEFLNRKDSFNQRTALHIAVIKGDSSVAMFLLQKGADINARDKNGYTALHYACALLSNQRQVQLQVIVALLSFPSIQLDIVSKIHSKSVLHVLLDCSSEGNDTVDSSYLQIVHNLLKQQQQQSRGNTKKVLSLLELRDDCGYTVLDSALLKKQSLVVDLFCSFKSSTMANNRDQKGEYTIHKAVESGDAHLLAQIIDIGADVNAVDSANNNSPLMIAICNRYSACVDLLLKKGANVFLCDKKERTAVHYATFLNNFDTVKLLLSSASHSTAKQKTQQHTNRSSNTSISPLHIAVKKRNLKIIELLLELHSSENEELRQLANIHACDSNGRTAFMDAARQGHIPVLDLLYNHQKAVNPSDISKLINAIDKDGDSALHLTSESGQVSSLEWLVKHGAEVNRFNSNRQDAVTKACLANQWNSVVYLLQQRIEPCNVLNTLSYLPSIHTQLQAEKQHNKELVAKNKQLEKELRSAEKVSGLVSPTSTSSPVTPNEPVSPLAQVYADRGETNVPHRKKKSKKREIMVAIMTEEVAKEHPKTTTKAADTEGFQEVKRGVKSRSDARKKKESPVTPTIALISNPEPMTATIIPAPTPSPTHASQHSVHVESEPRLTPVVSSEEPKTEKAIRDEPVSVPTQARDEKRKIKTTKKPRTVLRSQHVRIQSPYDLLSNLEDTQTITPAKSKPARKTSKR